MGSDAQDTARERQIKAAFLFNVLKFVEWPPSSQTTASAPLRLAILGRGPQTEKSSALEAKTVRGRHLVVQAYERVKDIEACDVLLVTPEAATDLADALRAAQGRPILTVSDTPDRAQTPAMITLTVVDTRLAFSVNLDTADASGLKMSSNLLDLAKSVQSQRVKQGRP